MRVFRGFDLLPGFRKPVVTLGSYDGVHMGHRQLLGQVMKQAGEKGGESVVMTFSPHPREVLGIGCGVSLLNTLDEKIMLLDSLGIDNLIVVPFTREFSRVSPYDFVKEFLVGRVGVDTLVVGYNHHFGRNKEGDFNSLESLRDEFGFDIFMVSQQQVDDGKVSSTVIRDLISKGDLAKAAKCLGYDYFISGGVSLENGAARVHTGDKCKLLPPPGDYPVRVCGGRVGGRGVLSVSSGGGLTLSGTGGLEAAEKIIVTF